MVGTLTRRALFARFRGGPSQLRPPWSKLETDFVEACTLCNKCIAACPTGLITRGHAGYPIVDFSHATCTFCGVCADSCESGCFEVRPDEKPWPLAAQISAACVEPKGVSCRMCEDACEARAIRFRPMLGGRASPAIDLDRCTGCGACVAPCPVKAISIVMPEVVS